MLGKTDKRSVNNFFGQLPEAKEIPLVSENLHKTQPTKPDYEALAPYFAYETVDVIRQTLRQSTQLAKAIIRFPMRKHFRTQFDMFRMKQLNEIMARDTYFSSIKSLEGYWCSQAFYGCKSKTINVEGMVTESEFEDSFKDFMRKRGIPHTLRRDNAKSENSGSIKELLRDHVIADQFTEPHHPHQNPAEWGAIKFLKSKMKMLMNKSGSPDNTWFLCQDYISEVHNVSANPNNNYKIPNEVSGGIQSISHTYCNFIGFNQSFTLIQHLNFQNQRKNLDTLLALQIHLVML